jgi:hypothetical protein
MQSNLTTKEKYIVMWLDPNNSVCKKGSVEYNGKTVFSSHEEALEAMKADKSEELECNPDSEITYEIFILPN